MSIQDQLDPGEEVLWEGVPPHGLIFRATDFFLVPFSLVWGGAVFFITLGTVFGLASGQKSAWPIAFILVLFFPVAVYITVGRFVLDALRRLRTAYAITNGRALILSGFFTTTLKSMPLTPSLAVEVSGDRVGSIIFGAEGGWSRLRWRGGLWDGPTHPFMFERIKNVREVYRLVREVQQGLHRDEDES